MTRSSWITVVVAGVVAAASIVFFWLNRPEWAYCIEAGPNQGCESGEYVSNAIAGTAAVSLGLVLLLVGLVVARGRRVIVIIAVALFVALLLTASVLQFVWLEDIPFPEELQQPHIS